MDWLNKVFNTIAQLASQVTQQRPQQRQQVRPQVRQELPTTPRRAFGNFAVQTAANQQQYSPSFLKTLMATNPIVDDRKVMFRAAAQYDPNTNQTAYTRAGMRPSIVTHEGLHAAWRQNPQIRQQFRAVQFNPGTQNILNKITSAGLYRGLSPNDRLNEMHSFGSERLGPRQNSSANQYYRQYFSQPAKPIMEEKSRRLYLNFNGPRINLPRINQNSFWRDN